MNTSQYKGGNKGRPMFVGNSSVEEVMNSFKSLKYATLAYSIRNGDAESAKAWEQLPAFTFAATFNGARTKNRMVEYNGVIQLNSVKLEPEQAIRIRDKAAQEPNTLAAFVTTEGTGVVILSPISSPDGSIPDSNEEISKFHAHAFSAVSSYYESCLHIDFKKNEHSLLQLTSADRPPRNFVRHASFFGTTNHMDILKDYTGSRRYLCNEVTGPINFDFTIDYKQLYAQAWNMILKSFHYYFNTEENDIVEKHNQHYMETDADMELFYEYYRKPEGEEEGIYLSAAKLADYIKSKTGIAISKKMIFKLGRNLKSLNYKFRTYQGTTQYKVILKDLGGEGGEK